MNNVQVGQMKTFIAISAENQGPIKRQAEIRQVKSMMLIKLIVLTMFTDKSLLSNR